MELIEKMNKFWETHNETKSYPGEEEKWLDLENQEGEELIDSLWDELFIGNHWNYRTKKILEDAGFECLVGDSDSFGILVACITKDGKSISIG